MRIFYHFGWIIGIGWLIIAGAQIFLGLQGQAITNFAGWSTYTWVGVVMFVLGVGWLLLWHYQYYYWRQSVE